MTKEEYIGRAWAGAALRGRSVVSAGAAAGGLGAAGVFGLAALATADHPDLDSLSNSLGVAAFLFLFASAVMLWTALVRLLRGLRSPEGPMTNYVLDEAGVHLIDGPDTIDFSGPRTLPWSDVIDIAPVAGSCTLRVIARAEGDLAPLVYSYNGWLERADQVRLEQRLPQALAEWRETHSNTLH